MRLVRFEINHISKFHIGARMRGLTMTEISAISWKMACETCFLSAKI